MSLFWIIAPILTITSQEVDKIKITNQDVLYIQPHVVYHFLGFDCILYSHDKKTYLNILGDRNDNVQKIMQKINNPKNTRRNLLSIRSFISAMILTTTICPRTIINMFISFEI